MKIKNINFKKILLSFVETLGIVLIFTLVDYFLHQGDSEYSVPSRYFVNKIIFGTIIGFIVLVILRKFKPVFKSLIFSATVAILLQVRYYIEGYSLDFVITFLVLHFLILFVASFLVFKYENRKK